MYSHQRFAAPSWRGHKIAENAIGEQQVVRAAAWSARRLQRGRRDARDGAVLLLRILLADGLQVVGGRTLMQRVHVAHTGNERGLGVASVLLELGGLPGK